MKSVLDSRKFIAAVLSSLIMGVLVALEVDLVTASFIVAPLAAYVPAQAMADLRGPKLSADEIEAIRKLVSKRETV